MTAAEIEISLSFSAITWPVLAQRGGSCSIVLTESMFSSSCIIQPVSTALFFFFHSLSAQVQEHVFAFNKLDVFCVPLLAGSSYLISITILSVSNPLNGSSGL